MTSDLRTVGLMRIARKHWENHTDGKKYEPGKMAAALFVEEVKACPKCAPEFEKLPS